MYAERAGLASLADLECLRGNVARIVAERTRLMEALSDVPYLRSYPSRANFILCRVVGRDALALKGALAARGILIRYHNSPAWPVTPVSASAPQRRQSG